MKKTNIILSIVYILFFCGCSNEKENQLKEDQKKQKKQVEYRKKVIDKLSKKYNISFNLDTINYPYSINYKPIIESKYQLIENFYISDIYNKDKIDYVALTSGYYSSIYFNFPIEKNHLIKLLSNNKCVLIVSITEIKKFQATFKTADNEDVTINFDSEDFIGKGKIVDVISIQDSSKL
jgi:hypothetical protein